MSLFTLPVSVSDLTQLQLGIEFFTNTPDATAEAGLITSPPSTPTVYSYAVELLAHNISLSQVAMAVDSLMFGVTDNATELAKLATQFLPPQMNNAVANGLNPTVYAAEALGLALAGGNGTSNAFAADFGSLPVSQFVSEVASLTGINSGAIQGFVQNWISFYTANPSATFGLSVTLAAYGAAFGDAVGAALLNPTVNGTLALLVSEEQNALIDNAEGRYQAGIALVAEPPHLPLQGEALLIPDAGGPPFGPTIDWAQFGASNYAQFIAPAQTALLTIKNAPSTFTLDTQHYGTKGVEIDAVGGNGNLFTLILGDSTAGDNVNEVLMQGYSTVEIVVPKGSGTDFINGIGFCHDLVISGSGSLSLGAVNAETITDVGVSLTMATHAHKIDASNAPVLVMLAPIPLFDPTLSGATVLGGTGPGNILHGSVTFSGSTVTFSNASTGVEFTRVGADSFTGGSGGGDRIYGDGGGDTITLPNHALSDTVVFGEDEGAGPAVVLAITDGMDVAYLGSWGAGATTAPIPTLFPGNTGGTSTDMTVITGFRAGSGGDLLDFKLAAWNGSSNFLGIAAAGDLISLNGVSVVPTGAAQLSAIWVNSGSNGSLNPFDNVLLYAPSDASVHNAQQLATQLHTASDSIVLPASGSTTLGFIGPGQDKHILVAYDASFNLLGVVHKVVNIADVDLVNTSASNQSSTANLNVYVSDMVSLIGVSLTSLTSANINFNLNF